MGDLLDDRQCLEQGNRCPGSAPVDGRFFDFGLLLFFRPFDRPRAIFALCVEQEPLGSRDRSIAPDLQIREGSG